MGDLLNQLSDTLVSADGVFEDPVNMGVGEYQDEAYLRDGLGLLTACDAILFGRSTYQAFAELYDSPGRIHKPAWSVTDGICHQRPPTSTPTGTGPAWREFPRD